MVLKDEEELLLDKWGLSSDQENNLMQRLILLPNSQKDKNEGGIAYPDLQYCSCYN